MVLKAGHISGCDLVNGHHVGVPNTGLFVRKTKKTNVFMYDLEKIHCARKVYEDLKGLEGKRTHCSGPQPSLQSPT